MYNVMYNAYNAQLSEIILVFIIFVKKIFLNCVAKKAKKAVSQKRLDNKHKIH